MAARPAGRLGGGPRGRGALGRQHRVGGAAGPPGDPGVTLPNQLAGAKVLVVDDDAALVGTLSWILREQGCHVVAVPDGQNLLERLGDADPDLVLLDIMMPKVDGLQLLERIRNEPRWRDLPVLMISSMDPEDGTAKALGLGASDFVAKPFRVKELLARVESQLKRGREMRTAREDARARGAIADILQCAVDGKGDHILAARFLNRFVPREVAWLHLDLAAGQRRGGLAHVGTDVTGFGVRFTLELLAQRWPRAHGAA
ncbi:MAG: hypothetical protein B7Z72_02190 [Gemmatimonadetes bacterium 21-71-4]|nr:MAG: hypothetical protein B7Z72_02190 [Gemmatimonadetes bacterium 21-71-4]